MDERSRISRSFARILLLLLVGGSLAIALAACGAAEKTASSNDAQPVEAGDAEPLEEARAELAELATKIRGILDGFKAEDPDNELIKKIEGYLGVLEEQPILSAEEAEAASLPEQELRSDPPDPTSIPDPVRRYAPVVYLHPNEWLYPIDADLFLAQSTLMWAHADCEANAIAAGAHLESDGGLPPLDADQLGTGGYSHPAGCAGEGSAYASDELTRPEQTGEERPLGLPLTEGFFLELDDAYRFGDPIAATSGKADGIPVYFEYEPNRFVTYWILYGASASPVPDPQFYAEATILAHEGDWEHVSVRLNERDEATHVFYASHGEGQELAWADVPKEEGTHPIVYSAWGSHASNPETGVFELDCPFSDACFYDFVESSETGWRTWEHLRSAREEPWYGFGGAWGTNWPTKKLSGALGPSSYKGPAPESW